MDKLKKKGARSLGGAKKKEYFCNYLGLLPFFILFGVFMLYPFLYGVVMSFTDWSVSSGKEGIIAAYYEKCGIKRKSPFLFRKGLFRMGIYEKAAASCLSWDTISAAESLLSL